MVRLWRNLSYLHGNEALRLAEEAKELQEDLRGGQDSRLRLIPATLQATADGPSYARGRYGGEAAQGIVMSPLVSPPGQDGLLGSAPGVRLCGRDSTTPA